jgi:hypothetical protein
MTILSIQRFKETNPGLGTRLDLQLQTLDFCTFLVVLRMKVNWPSAWLDLLMFHKNRSCEYRNVADFHGIKAMHKSNLRCQPKINADKFFRTPNGARLIIA